MYAQGKTKEFKEKYTVTTGLRNICLLKLADL